MQDSTNKRAPPGYIQRGVIALRAPDGEFMASVPFYEKAEPATRKGEKQLIKDAAELFDELLADVKGGELKMTCPNCGEDMDYDEDTGCYECPGCHYTENR